MLLLNPHTCNKAPYVVMVLLFGSFGVHKFCSNCIWMGLFYAIFCWMGIPAIIGIIEGFTGNE
ncbi:TM2 domain-containing protein [Neisseria iguanae]|uniref:TM2 domain-containing protein n=1 Tax=Neisseria iguanae TaxID=90242 RepID=A0A2P7U2P9_9NEIS|nr:NINE protein [Neisseria iguanae]PSJ81259.1 hypothetical protein C7N83_01570 [Neisseria iguanae]